MSIVDGLTMHDLHSVHKRPLIRSVKNPMDRCTIVSILPKEIREFKHTIEPGMFEIAKGSPENPTLLVVGSSSWWRDFDPDQPMLEITNSSIQVAESVVKDYCNGMLGCDMNESMPGLFFVLGEHSLPEIKLKYKNKLDEMKKKQDNWFHVLVKIADSLWARSNNNPLTISEEMRLAARMLNLNDKPWIKDFVIAQMTPCMFCGALKNPLYPICPSCKSVDTKHPLAKDIVTVK